MLDLELGGGGISKGAFDLPGVVAFAQVAREPLELKGHCSFQSRNAALAHEAVNAVVLGS